MNFVRKKLDWEIKTSINITKQSNINGRRHKKQMNQLPFEVATKTRVQGANAGSNSAICRPFAAICGGAATGRLRPLRSMQKLS